jgi:hypothetical protein
MQDHFLLLQWFGQQLETIYKVKLTDEKASHSVFKTVPLTKEQEKIYKALNLLS